MSDTSRRAATEILRRHMYRWKNWKLLESAGLSPESRLLQISTALLSAVSEDLYWTPDFFDAAVDLFDFFQYSSVPELRQVATDHLIVCISSTRDSWEPLSVVLDLVSRAVIVGERPSISLRYGPYNPKSPSSSSFLKTHTKTASEQMFDYHPQLREFLRYAHLRPHARDAHLQFCLDNHHPFIGYQSPVNPEITAPSSPRDEMRHFAMSVANKF
ncbi:hypothetical protein B0H19DRAFT_1124662 [Mycena capillaripes]|nr:hypothetical protein B0H19DRAFT_1124662 [Mycena capillaripes]